MRAAEVERVPKKCDVCAGEGTVPQDHPPGTDLNVRQVTCPRCGGGGKTRCGIVGPVCGMHQDGACVLEPRHAEKKHKNASGNEWPVKEQAVVTAASRVATLRSYGREMLDILESDSNVPGLADYIEELRREIAELRAGQQRVLEWIGAQGCYCESADADDPHTDACPGVAERLLKGAPASSVVKHVPWSCAGDYDSCRRAWCAKHEGNLFMCAVCGQAEADLEPSCPGPKTEKVSAPSEPKPKRTRVRRNAQGHIRAPGDCASGECGTCSGCLVRSME